MTIPRLITVRIAAASLGRPPRSLESETEDWIERDGEYDAPGQDRHKGADEDESPDDQESEQSEPDRKLDDVLSGQKLAKGFQGRAFI